MSSRRRLALLLAAATTAALLAGCGADPPTSPRPTGANSGSASPTASAGPATATAAAGGVRHALLTQADAERILGVAVQRVDSSGRGRSTAPGCPALADLGKEADSFVGFESGDQDLSIAEFVVTGAKETPLLEALKLCSRFDAAGATINVAVRSAPGGPGNVDGTVEASGNTVELRARVADGANIELLMYGTSPARASDAATTAVARYTG
ncbi:hypothetical protein [Kitasatospora sp. NPDC057015]|uniref:hypothetical protein n=1 Tax=Kitasatospora sp. NPDC057015 TaxID=3346001 RepID=UPI003642211F